MSLLNIRQAAEHLGYSVSGLRKLLRKPDGPPFKKIGQIRFRREELDAWIDTRSAPGAPESAPERKKKAGPNNVEPAFGFDPKLLDL